MREGRSKSVATLDFPTFAFLCENLCILCVKISVWKVIQDRDSTQRSQRSTQMDAEERDMPIENPRQHAPHPLNLSRKYRDAEQTTSYPRVWQNAEIDPEPSSGPLISNMPENSPPYDLITMGRSSIDLYANDVGAPFVEIKSFAAYVGGSPTNIAVGGQRLGLRTSVLTAVGEDPVGDFILNFLKQEGVETKFIPRKPGRRTSAVVLGIEPPDKFPLVYYRDNCADNQLSIDDVLNTPIQNCRIFEFSGTGLAQEPSRSANLFAAEQAKAAGATVVLDLDFRPNQWHDARAFGTVVRSVLPLVDIVLGTEDEAKAVTLADPAQVRVEHSQISGARVAGDVNAAVKAIQRHGPKLVVVKRGERGATLFEAGQPMRDVPGFPVEVYNVLGAGDAFAAGFIYGLVKKWDYYKAARMGNAGGAIVVTRHGCANFMAYEKEALSFVEERGGF